MTKLSALPDRAVLVIEGEDRVSFLQGLVSNDIELVAPGQAVWTALLTPQGRWLADFFVLIDGERLLLDVEAEQASMLAPRLSRFRLRSRVSVRTEPALSVFVAWDGAPALAGVIAPDPRLAAAGWRILTSTQPETNATPEDWDRHRLGLGLPDGSRDLESDRTVLLEAGFDELSGVSWSKGCYMGQELTARTHYRGLVKRRLVPVRIDGAIPKPGTPIHRAGMEVGTMRSARDDRGLAVVRLEALDGPLSCAGAALRVEIPSWMRLPAHGRVRN
jgi:folate-binding protein YgfZ